MSGAGFCLLLAEQTSTSTVETSPELTQATVKVTSPLFFSGSSRKELCTSQDKKSGLGGKQNGLRPGSNLMA